MATNETVNINGRVYDALTGLPINKSVPDVVSRVPNHNAKASTAQSKAKPEAKKKTAPAVERKPATTATAVHSQTQRSQTLLRRSAKKPAPHAKRPTTGRHMDMARSSKITKFAPHPVTKEVKPVGSVPVKAASPKPKADKAPQVHPVAAKAISRTVAKKPVVATPATSKEVKNAAIAVAMAAPKAKPTKASQKKSTWPRRIIIVGSITLALGLILYGVYHFIPSVSVGIASAQAGVKANYPEYVPDGYALSHPVTYRDGEVALKFNSNSNQNSYTITQTRSTWDSSAVLDNVVRPATGENYITTKERGLTVYSYENNAAWVNRGVLYVISGDNAPLSGEQIRHIATSL